MKGLNLYLINGMYWITASLYLPFITMYFSQKGMDSMQIGILSALLPIASLTVQPDSAESVLCGGSSALSRNGFLW